MRNYRNVLVDIVMDEGGGKFLEIGVLKGRTCKRLLHCCDQVLTEYWAIDPWAVVKTTRRARWTQEKWDRYYLYTVRLMLFYEKLRVVRTTSLKFFELARGLNKYFDIGFIDGDHSYESVIADVGCWKTLIRKGGLLLGHDYSRRFPGVVKAVDEEFGPNIDIFPGHIWAVRL